MVFEVDDETAGFLGNARVSNARNLDGRHHVGTCVLLALVHDLDDALGLVYAVVQVYSLSKDSPTLNSSDVSSRQVEVFWQLYRQNASLLDWKLEPEPNSVDRHFLHSGVACLDVTLLWVDCHRLIGLEWRYPLVDFASKDVLAPRSDLKHA